MKKQYELVRTLLIVVFVLVILQIFLLVLEPDLKHIIFTCVAGTGLIAIIILFIILKIEINKVIYEYKDEHYEIRLVDYDDFQNVRVLMCDTPISNTKEEVTILQEYEKETTDLTRIRYHYIIFKDNNPVGLIYVIKEKGCFNIKQKKILEENKEEIRQILLDISSKHHSMCTFDYGEK